MITLLSIHIRIRKGSRYPEVWTITFARDLAVASPGRAILTKGKPKFRRGHVERSRSQLLFHSGGAENLSILAVNALAVNVLAVNSVS